MEVEGSKMLKTWNQKLQKISMFRVHPVNGEVSCAIILPRSKAAKESKFSVDSDSPVFSLTYTAA